MFRVLGLLALLGALLVTVAGCGGSSDSSEGTTTVATEGTTSATEEEEESTPEQAVAEIATIRSMLDEAVTTYASGDQKSAADAVGDIYLEHYEKVEGPLGDVDHDLMEEIEEAISTDLRKDMEAGVAQSEIEAQVTAIKSKLDQAEQALS